jgi:hypothetical protein
MDDSVLWHWSEIQGYLYAHSLWIVYCHEMACLTPFFYHWMCRNSAKRTRITGRNSRQTIELDQNPTLNWVLRMYEPTHSAWFAAHCALMFVASNCCTTCREIRKLEKSQTVLLSGKSPTARMDHGLPKSPKKFTWVYWLRSYSKLT